MLRISKLADYGTIIMVYFARRPSDSLSNAREIALKTHINVPTVSKLLKKLTSSGLLTSVRGVCGGYKLQRSAEEISVAEIISALEEQQGLTECSLHHSDCSLEGICHVQGNWRLLSRAIEAALDSVSLAALAKPALQTIDIERVRQIASSGVSRDEK